MPSLEELFGAYNARRAALDQQGAYFLRDITDDEAERFSKSLLIMSSQRKGVPEAPITIHINSGGGSVGAGFAMMEMMYKMKRDYGIVFHTIITGYAYSMGAIIFQAGDKRSMGYFSTMMLHSTQWMVSGEDQKIFQDYEKLARQYQNLIGELFARRTGQRTPAWWQRFIYSGRDRFLSPTECLKLGLVDEICSFESCYTNPSQLGQAKSSFSPSASR